MNTQTNPNPEPVRKSDPNKVRRLTLAALLTAVVVVLALLSAAIKFGTFNINLALVPIVIGAALLGVWYGAWFGFVNAMVILLSGDAAPFFAVNVAGTIITVIAKGVLAGLASGAVYQLMQRWNKYAAVLLAAFVCPVVNTGVFLIGCLLFFWKTIGQWAEAAGMHSVFGFALVGLIGVNFLVELAINLILSPVIARILGFSEDKDTTLLVYGCVLAVIGYGFLIFALVLLYRAHGNLEQTYVVKRGLNPVQRYLVVAVFSDVVRIGGIVLMVMGLTRRRTRADLEAKLQKQLKK